MRAKYLRTGYALPRHVVVNLKTKEIVSSPLLDEALSEVSLLALFCGVLALTRGSSSRRSSTSTRTMKKQWQRARRSMPKEVKRLLSW